MPSHSSTRHSRLAAMLAAVTIGLTANLVDAGNHRIATSAIASFFVSSKGDLLYCGDTLYAFGEHASTPTLFPSNTMLVPQIPPIVALSASEARIALVTADGSVWAWGEGLGLPHQILGLPKIVDVSIVSSHVMALSTNGEVWAWGANYNCGLGRAPSDGTSSPAKIAGLSDVIAITAGNSWSTATTRSGEVYRWGCLLDENDEPIYYEPTPRTFGVADGLVSADTDSDHAAVRRDGSVWAWGMSTSTIHSSPDPLQLFDTGLRNVVALAGAETPSFLALTGSGDVYGLYVNDSGALGVPEQSTPYTLSPLKVPDLTDIVEIAHYATHSLALDKDGTVWGMGSDAFSALCGMGGGAYQNAPQPIRLLGNPFQIGASGVTPTPNPNPTPTPEIVVAQVVEYYWAARDHYFITAIADEITALDKAAAGANSWGRTGKTFNSLSSQAANSTPVCRFYLPPPAGSHFYGRSASECEAVHAKFPDFVYESPAVMYMHLPTNGSCTAGTLPVYRMYNNRVDPNHRYTTDRSIRDLMVAQGWIAEGEGSDLVVMCAPQ